MLVLAMRNDPGIMQWMYSQHEIGREEHLSFIGNLEMDISRQHMLVTDGVEALGVVDFTGLDGAEKVTCFGLYGNPFRKIAGAGRILEEICITYAFDILKMSRLRLEVFDDNRKAINLHRKYGFEPYDTRRVHEKVVICMQKTKQQE